MPAFTYHVAHVFTRNGKNGNGLGVLINAKGLSAKRMQRIAEKLGFSETSFVSVGNPGNCDYDVRFFTPEKEIPFAGHPSIGTLFVLLKLGLLKKKERYVQQIGERKVKLSLHPGGRISMDQGKPKFLGGVTRCVAADLLGLRSSDLSGDGRVVTTGLPHLLVPVRSLKALRSACIYPPTYTRISGTTAEAVMPFTVYRGNIYCRMFAPSLGITEDPATGSGAGPLAAFVAREGMLESAKNGGDVTIFQGADAESCSRLYAMVDMTSRGVVSGVEVGGYCAIRGAGEIAIG